MLIKANTEAAATPLLTLSNGKTIPVLGLGTWKSKPELVYQAVKTAILDHGYRHIDCAHVYENESEIGRALTEVLESGAVSREELFITSKLWNTFHSPHLVRSALDMTLKNLGLDYLDLFLVHWPFGFQEGGAGMMPLDGDGKYLFSDVDFVDTWKGMEEVYEAGLVKSIGVANFNSEQITRVLESAKVKPVVNQVECHSALNQTKLFEFCRPRGIQVVAYSPLGSPGRRVVKAEDPAPLTEPKVAEIGAKLGKSPAQVLLRYQIQRDIVVIPKSVSPSRIGSNMDVFDFELSDDQMKTISSLNQNKRLNSFGLEATAAAKYYPFNIPF